MPSFSSFLKRSKRVSEGKNDPPDQAQAGGSDAIGNVKQTSAEDKVQRRQSKRDFFRNLMPGTAPRSDSRASQRGNQVKTPVYHKPSEKPMPDSNKPLPAPPPSSEKEADRPTNPTTRLNRIISPLTLPDLHKLFSGAPQFFARSEGAHTGPPNPSVAFPWNSELQIRDLSDHGQIEDQAWSTVTAKQHITRDFGQNKEAMKLRHEKLRAHYAPKCHERPNMLSAQGLERGTLGFAAALELGVADALKEEDEPPTSPVESLAKRRSNFLKDKHGVRRMDESTLISRLVDISAKDSDDSTLHQRTSVELYTELFTQILHPPTRVTDSDDPYSLHVQIEALIDVLAIPHLWIDFSLVEWRIRLGQILWSEPYEPDTGDQVSINGETVHDAESQQFWLLLQILLSCELLVRLDIVTKKAEKDPDVITADEVRHFEKDATAPVRWSMILARLWLENIHIDETKLVSSTEEKKQPAGWLATLTGTAHAQPVDTHARLDPSSLHIKHPRRQILGLIHFARKLDWPQVDILADKFSSIQLSSEDGPLATPVVGTPLSMTTHRSSYFSDPSVPRKPSITRGLSKQQARSAVIRPEGWLSRSYLSGLILPGEGLSHFLISTLLENDDHAVAHLGEEANLYGGFVYMGKSFWSTACIVGRVLAAGKGASECMGWLSSDVIPKGLGDGWVNVEVDLEPPLGEESKSQESARIWKKQAIEKDGHVLGDGDASTLLPGDFTLPGPDVRDKENLEVRLESLELFVNLETVPEGSSEDEPPTSMSELNEVNEIRNYAAMMKFSVTWASGSKEMDFALEHDVHFVTAHPCVPSQHAKLLQSPTSPSFAIPSPALFSENSKAGPHDLYAGHPLHKSFAYKREVFSHILLPSLIRRNSESQHPLESLHTTSNEVFVIDCTEPSPPSTSPTLNPADSGIQVASSSALANIHVTRKRRFGSDLEMMARAWCAEKGYNALISRRGRNCIACSIREARALGWKIVLRFG